MYYRNPPQTITHNSKMCGRSVQSYAKPGLTSWLVSVDLQFSNGSADALKDLSIEEAKTIRLLLDLAIRDAEDYAYGRTAVPA